jgi:hypothetical protein
LHELTHNHTHISHSSQNVQQENADVVMNLKSNVASDYHDQVQDQLTVIIIIAAVIEALLSLE